MLAHLPKSLAHAGVMLACAYAYAGPPVAAISGPDRGNPGDIIILSSEGASDFVDWEVDATKVDIPVSDAAANLKAQADALRAAGFVVEEPPQDAPPVYLILEATSGGKRLQMSSYPGVYRIKLAVSNSEGVDQTEKIVTIGKGITPPPVPPVPPVPPDVTEPPAGEYAIARPLFHVALKVGDKGTSQKIAGVLGAAALKGSPQEMIDHVASELKTLDEATKVKWGGWRTAYLTELQRLQPTLGSDASKWRQAYVEAALGMAYVSLN